MHWWQLKLIILMSHLRISKLHCCADRVHFLFVFVWRLGDIVLVVLSLYDALGENM